MTFNGNRINLPKSVTIMFRDKFKIRHIVTNKILYLPQVHWGYYQTFIWSLLAMGRR